MLHRSCALAQRLTRPVSHQSRCIASAARKLHKTEGEKRVQVTSIPGDGVSPELISAVQHVFSQTGIPVDFEEKFLSEVHSSWSEPLDEVVASIYRNNGVALQGVIQPAYLQHLGELQSLGIKLRRALDLFANVVRIKNLPGVESRHSGLDMVIIREQTEGEYSALEHESVSGIVESLKISTRPKIQRIAKFAFDYATKHGRKKVTAVHKANIMKLGDGLFLHTCEEISELYPHVEFDNMIIDNCCMQLVARPQQFDVMVMPNLYGNIIDNLAAGLVGGAGIVAGESYGRDCVVFEQGARHSYQHAIGRNIANPTAMLLAAGNMLRHVNLFDHGDRLTAAVEKVGWTDNVVDLSVGIGNYAFWMAWDCPLEPFYPIQFKTQVLAKGLAKTIDIGGYATTAEFADAVVDCYVE